MLIYLYSPVLEHNYRFFEQLPENRKTNSVGILYLFLKKLKNINSNVS